VRTQFARLGIDDLQFFFDPEREDMILFADYPLGGCVSHRRFFGEACAPWID
jgi:hypothetical protein